MQYNTNQPRRWASMMITLLVLFGVLGTPSQAQTRGAASLPTEEMMTDAELIQRAEEYLDQLVAEDNFSGAVLIARDGKPLFQQAYGLASIAYNVPNRIDTKFNLGSMNKMFTAVAIAQLAEAGKLTFEDTIGQHLPDYPNQEAAKKVTIPPSADAHIWPG
jgi:CubicO group peptidase (beta-lactamase class C family)